MGNILYSCTGHKKLGGADVILFGRRAVDGETQQVGPQTAVWLNVPAVAYTDKIIEIDQKNKRQYYREPRNSTQKYLRFPYRLLPPYLRFQIRQGSRHLRV